MDEDEKKPLSEVLRLGVEMTVDSTITYNEGKAIYINESGVYNLIFRSTMPAHIPSSNVG